MLIYGKNEAHDRLMGEAKHVNPEGSEYPKATNNRGALGGKFINPSETGLSAVRPRERHAKGDHVGSRDAQLMKKRYYANGDMVGARAQPGENLPEARKRGGHTGHKRRHHSAGEEVVPAAQEQPGEHLRKFKRGGHKKHFGRRNGE